MVKFCVKPRKTKARRAVEGVHVAPEDANAADLQHLPEKKKWWRASLLSKKNVGGFAPYLVN